MQISVEEIYGDVSIDQATLDALFLRSLQPRASDTLYDKMGELGLATTHLLLDIGCRDARHTCELVKRYGCQAVGIDPVDRNIRLCAQTIAGEQLTAHVRVEKARIEAMPLADASIDFIWCRDVLTHVRDLHGAFAECGRVLKPGGKMLVYQTFATDLLEPIEAERLFGPLAVVNESMAFGNIEAALADTGLSLQEKDVIGSEWREWWEENGPHTTSQQLLQIARMQRDRERLIGEVGSVLYEVKLANCIWGVYQMLGKLEPTAYVLAK